MPEVNPIADILHNLKDKVTPKKTICNTIKFLEYYGENCLQ